ncbi:bifunctional folylpolyglutamate synthase/dihydrofolate synthase [Liquorilactobacillus sicerae]|uniref:bifunctional folylpolyglutamate synthase/dihydrofolate synthase n=1 Tax=Liquorilactobacillus sicerae TaxID=1416943 RepID=UPI0024808A08|nr:folylpolyglutamate synthase/dihydrofolate synthase family protein [Liquorilactobacillus sicerae]
MQIKKVTTYQEALNFIHGRTKFKKSPQLDRMRLFTEKLGHPEKKFCSIHVTGTNGKGSTVAFLRELFLNQGLHVGTFTSPFIIKFNDRITFDGQMISDQELVKLVRKVQPVVAQLDAQLAAKEGGPTEFEIITAIMFLYFAAKKPDIAIIEVGIGGKFDSTNVIDPLVSVITTVAHDHAKLLGKTLTEIANHKAGIIKPNRPVVVGDLPAAALKVIEQKAQQTKSTLYQLGKDFKLATFPSQQWGEIINYQGFGYKLTNLQLSLLGSFQPANAALSLSAFLLMAKQLQLNWRIKEIKAALAQTKWPGRFELVNQQPLIVLDGAHNLAAFIQLKQTLQTYFKERKIYVIVSILADKQPKPMLAELLKIANVEIIGTNFAAPRKIADLQSITAVNERTSFRDDWRVALVKTIRQMSSDDLLLICGSLYFISEVRHYFAD